MSVDGLIEQVSLVDSTNAFITGTNPLPVTLAAPASSILTGVAIGKVSNGAGTSGAVNVIRATTYTEQTANFTGSVKSASANDTAAGTGARTMKVTYYDQTVAGPNAETATLNGVTAVNLVNTNHCFIERKEVVTVGTGLTNAGILSLFTGAAGAGTLVSTIATIASGGQGFDGRTYYAHHYVAAGKTATITGFNCGTDGNQSGEAFLKAKDPTNANSFEEQISDSISVGSASSPASQNYGGGELKVAGPARVTEYQIPNGNGTIFFGSLKFQEQ